MERINLKQEIGNDYIIPAADIYENDREFVIKTEMPGISKENATVVFNNGYLEITGKADNEWEKEYDVVDREFRLADYYRKFYVGDKIDNGNINVKLENGVLVMKLGKSENVKPRKIEITS